MSIVSRQAVTKAYARAIALGASSTEAVETIAQAMALPPEAVRAVVLGGSHDEPSAAEHRIEYPA